MKPVLMARYAILRPFGRFCTSYKHNVQMYSKTTEIHVFYDYFKMMMFITESRGNAFEVDHDTAVRYRHHGCPVVEHMNV